MACQNSPKFLIWEYQTQRWSEQKKAPLVGCSLVSSIKWVYTHSLQISFSIPYSISNRLCQAVPEPCARTLIEVYVFKDYPPLRIISFTPHPCGASLSGPSLVTLSSWMSLPHPLLWPGLISCLRKEDVNVEVSDFNCVHIKMSLLLE